MLPGLTRTAAQPASIAANTYLGWKWMSAITGICDFRAIAGSASASSWLGQATRTIWQPDAVSSAICCRVALTSAVRVVVIDCTETGCSLPTPTAPTSQLPGGPARGQGRRREVRACPGRRSRPQYRSRHRRTAPRAVAAAALSRARPGVQVAALVSWAPAAASTSAAATSASSDRPAVPRLEYADDGRVVVEHASTHASARVRASLAQHRRA